MRHAHCIMLALCLGALTVVSTAQEPKGKPKDGTANAAAIEAIVARMMAFDKNKDGKLTREEITDPRLLRLFDRADVNKDGVVTRDELVALATQLVAEQAQEGGGKGGPGGLKGGYGDKGGPGGPGGFGKPPRPGQILPPFVQETLKLTDAQKKQLEDLQSEVDTKLGKILTDDQKQQLKELRKRGPGGPKPPPPPPKD